MNTLDIPDGDRGQDTAAGLRLARRPDRDNDTFLHLEFLITQSNLEFLDMNMDYLESNGTDLTFYIVYDSVAHMPLNATKLRHISTVLTWPEYVLHRNN